MKKLALGCGLALILTGVVAAGVAYYVFRQVSSVVTQFAELGQVTEIERGVRKRGPFNPPVGAVLSERQVQQLVQVQQEVRRRLGEQMKAFEAKYRQLAQKEDATLADAPALLRAYGDLAKTWMEAKRVQVEALNAADLSLDEYRWIRDQAYRALGQPFVDLDIAKLVEEAGRGVTSSDTVGQLKGAIGATGPEVNRKLIERVKKVLEDNLALASFGL
ncbi:MAG TPA: hypothetical protein VFZ38_09790 [Vicinamibacterales bacterium]